MRLRLTMIPVFAAILSVIIPIPPAGASSFESTRPQARYQTVSLGTLLDLGPKKVIISSQVFTYVYRNEYSGRVMRRNASSCRSMTLTFAHKRDSSDDKYYRVNIVRENMTALTFLVPVGKQVTKTFDLPIGGLFSISTRRVDGEIGIVYANGSASCSTLNGSAE